MKGDIKKLTIWTLVLIMFFSNPIKAIVQVNDYDSFKRKSEYVNTLDPIKPVKLEEGQSAEDLIKNPKQPDIYTLRKDYKIQENYKYRINYQPYVASVGEDASQEEKAKINKTIKLPDFPGYNKPAESFVNDYDQIVKAAKEGQKTGDQESGFTYKNTSDYKYEAIESRIKVKHIFQKLDDFTKYTNPDGSVGKEGERTNIQRGNTGSLMEVKPLEDEEIKGFVPESKYITMLVPASEEEFLLEYRYNRASFDVIYDTKDGAPIPSRTLYYEQKIPETEIPTKIGADFLGWKPSVDLVGNNGKKYKAGEIITDESDSPILNLDAGLTMPAENVTFTAEWKDKEKANYAVQFWAEKADHADDASILEKYDYIGTRVYENADTGHQPTLADEPIKGIKFPDLDENRLNKIWAGMKFNRGRNTYLDKFYIYNKDLTDKQNADPKDPNVVKGVSSTGQTVYNIYYDRQVYDLYFTKSNAQPDKHTLYPEIWGYDPAKGEAVMIGGPGNLYHYKARFNELMYKWPNDAKQTKGFTPGYQSFGWGPNYSVPNWPVHLDTPPYRLNASQFLDMDNYTSWGGYTKKIDKGDGTTIDLDWFDFTTLSFGIKQDHPSIPHHMDFWMDGFKDGETIIRYDLVRTKADTDTLSYGHKYPEVTGFKPHDYEPGNPQSGWPVIREGQQEDGRVNEDRINELNDERDEITPNTSGTYYNNNGIKLPIGQLDFIPLFFSDSDKFGDPKDGAQEFKENGYLRFKYTRNKYPLRFNYDPSITRDDSYFNSKNSLDTFYEFPLKVLSPDLVDSNLDRDDKEYFKEDPKNLLDDPNNLQALGLTDLVYKDPNDNKLKVKRPKGLSDQMVFKGWALDPAGEKLVWENKGEKMPTHPVNLYAKWGEPDYKWKVTFDPDGGKLDPIAEENLTEERRTIQEGDIGQEEKNTYAKKGYLNESPTTEDGKQIFTVIQRQKLVEPVKPRKKGYEFMGWEIIRYKKDKSGNYTDEKDTSYRDRFGVPELYSFKNDVVGPVYLKAIWIPNDRVDINVEHYILNDDYTLDESIKQNPKPYVLEDKRAGYLVSTTGDTQNDKYLLAPHKELVEKLTGDLKQEYEDYNKRTNNLNNSLFQTFRAEPGMILNKETNQMEENPAAKNNVFKFFYRPFRHREYKVNYIDERFKGQADEKAGAIIPQEIVKNQNRHYDARNYRPIQGWVLTSKPQQQIFFDLNEATNKLEGINGTGKNEITFYYKDVRIIEVPGDKNPPEGYVRVTFKAEEGGSFGKDEKGKDIKEIHYDVIKGLKSDLIPVPKELKEGEKKDADKFYISPDAGRRFTKWDNSSLLNDNTIIEKDYTFKAHFDWEEIKIKTLVVTEAFKDPKDLWTNDFVPSLEKIKEQVKWYKDKVEADLPAGAEVIFKDGIEKDLADWLGEKGKSDQEELSREVKIPAQIKYADNSIQDIEIPVKVYKNVYEASTTGEKTLFLLNAESEDLKDVTGDYVKVRVNPSGKTSEKDSKIYYVNKNAWVEIPEIQITDEEKINLGFLNWTSDNDSQNENKKPNGIYDFAKRHKFTEDTVIYPVFSDDVVPQEGADKPNVPSSFVKVIVKTTDKATEQTAFEKTFWVNPTKEVELPVTNPVGKESQPGLGKQKVDYTFKEWQKVKIGESDDNLQDVEPEKIDLSKNKYTDKVTVVEALYDKTLQEAKTDFTVEKVWEIPADKKLEANDYPTVNFTLYRKDQAGNEEKVDGAEVKQITKEVTEASWKDLPQLDSKGNEYSYFVKETFKNDDIKNDNWILGEMETKDGKNTITNKLKTLPGETGNEDGEKNFVAKLTIKKVLENEPKQQISVRMMRSVQPSDPLKFKFKVSGPYGYENTFELSANESKTLDKLAFGEYKVEEIDSKGYTAEYSKEKETLTKENTEGFITVTNKNIKSNDPNVTNENIRNITVKKVWIGGGEKPATTIELWRKGYDLSGREYEQKVDDFTTTENGDAEQSKEFENLAKHDASGKEFTYYAKEVKVPAGYTATYSEDKLTVTNAIDFIKDETPEDQTDKPEGYVTVTFKAGDHGKIDGETEDIVYYVNPKADPVKVMQDIAEPEVSANIGYKVSETKWKDAEGKALDKETQITKDLTYTAQYKAKVVTENPNDEDYVKVDFVATRGTVEGQAEYWVLKNEEVSLTAPTVNMDGVTDYAFKAWDPEVKTSYAENTTHNATFTYTGEDIVPQAGEERPDVPANFVLVEFKEGAHGTLEGTSKYWVNPEAGKTLADITKPTVTAEEDYKYTGWDKADATAIGAEGLTVTAQYKAKVVTENPNDEDYVKVDFVATRGTVEGQAEYWVLKNEEVSLTAPTVNMDGVTDYAFKAWDPEVKTSYAENTTHNATFTYTGEDIVPQAGEKRPDVPANFVLVEFKEGAHGTLEGTSKYWVNPEAGKTLADITKPTVTAAKDYKYTGWDKEDATEIKGALEVTASYKSLLFNKDKITSIEFTKDPNKMTYTEGDNPVHDGLEITITDENGNTQVVTKDKLEDFGITVTPGEDAGLTKGENGKHFVAKVNNKDGEEITINSPGTITVKDKEYTEEDIIPYLPNEDEPTKGSDNKEIPSTYITVIFESESAEKGEVKVGAKQGVKVLAKVKPGTNLAGKAQAIAKEGYGFTVWTPELAEAQAEQPYVASFIKSDDKVGENDPIPAGWFRVTVQQDDNSIVDGTVTKTTYAVAPNGKLSADKFVDLAGKAKEGFENPGWYFNEDKEATANPSEVAITGDTTITAKASEVVIPELEKSKTPEVNKITEGDDKITGKGEPGSDIVVELPDGTKVPGKVDENRNWEVEVPADKPLNKDDVIKVVQTEEGKDPSDPAKATVNEKPVPASEKSKTPEINKVTEGDNKITGEGEPGSDIIVELPDGTKVPGKVDKNRNWEVEVPADKPLNKDDVIKVVQTEEGKDPSDPAKATVNEKPAPAPEKSKTPTVDKITEGDNKITGKGEPGSDIIVELPDGTKVPGKVDENRNWEIEVPADKPLNKDDVIKVVQKEEGKDPSDPAKATVNEKPAPAPENSKTPEVNKGTEGDDKIKGKGESKPKPAAPSQSTGSEVAKTGDTSYVALVAGLLSLAMAGALIVNRKRDEE